MAESTDYYDLLQITRFATAAEVKRAYRRLARTFHPDRNAGDPAAGERFKAIQEAYGVLSDPARRRAYDRDLPPPFWRPDVYAGSDSGAHAYTRMARTPEAAEARPASGYDPRFAYVFRPAEGIGDSRGSTADARGGDVETQVHLSFEEALRGGCTSVRLADGDVVRLTVPPGVRTGMKLRVRGGGRPTASGERGNLYVTFRVAPSERFRREGDHLHVVVVVSALEAMLGTRRSVENAYGQSIKVQIPPGTQPGERLRLRGQGVVTPKRTGDLFVEVQVTVPRALSEAQRAELAETAARLGLL